MLMGWNVKGRNDLGQNVGVAKCYVKNCNREGSEMLVGRYVMGQNVKDVTRFSTLIFLPVNSILAPKRKAKLLSKNI